jgi:phosphoglycolate phosphatase-like HAD superfamily hydrolase
LAYTLDELAQFVGRVARDHAAAGVDHRPLGPLDGGRHLGDLLRLHGPWLGAVARQVHRHVVIRDKLRDLDIFRQVHEHRAGAARRGDEKRLLHHAGDVGRVGDEIMMLRDPAADLDDRRLLEGVSADHARAHLAGEGDHGDAVHLGVGDRRHEVEGARAARGHAHAGLAGGAGVALGRERAPLLVPREDRADPVLGVGERLVERHARPARIGEDHVDPVADQRLDDHVGPGHEAGGGRWSGDGGHGKDSWGGRSDNPSTIPDKNALQKPILPRAEGAPGLADEGTPQFPRFLSGVDPKDRSKAQRRADAWTGGSGGGPRGL